MTQYDERPSREALTPSDVTSLWRRLEALRRRPPDARIDLFDRLGVSPEKQRRIDELLDHLGDIRIVEPGLVLDEPSCDLGWQPSVLRRRSTASATSVP